MQRELSQLAFTPCEKDGSRTSGRVGKMINEKSREKGVPERDRIIAELIHEWRNGNYILFDNSRLGAFLDERGFTQGLEERTMLKLDAGDAVAFSTSAEGQYYESLALELFSKKD